MTSPKGWFCAVLFVLSVGCDSNSDSENNGAQSSNSSVATSVSSAHSSSVMTSSAISSTQTSSSSSSHAATPTDISLSFLSRYSSDVFLGSAAEITAFHPATQRAFVVNAQAGQLDILDLSDLEKPEKYAFIDANDIAEGAVVNSVAVHGDLIALAIEAPVKTDPGYVGIYSADDYTKISHVSVGAQPDMLVFTPNGQYILVANEGEPNEDYSIDPEGSVSVIDISDLETISVATAGFHAFNGQEDALRVQGVRIFGPGASAAQDFEPEYIAVSADSAVAWVALQENNALARVDVASATVTDIFPLGYKDHGLAANAFGSSNAFDASDADGGINIQLWPGVYGMYHPDSIAAYEVGGHTYIVTANEGDARAWGEDDQAYWDGDASKGFVEEIRLKHLVHSSGFARRIGNDMPPQLTALAGGALLNPEVFGYCGATAGDPGNCREDEHLGRLTVTWTQGYRVDDSGAPVMFNTAGEPDPEGDRLMYDAIYSFGARSFSIWNESGELVWDSGDQMEQYLASDVCMAGAERNIPCKDYFNTNHSAGDSMDNRSDNKGPEPEGVAMGQLGDKTYAFLGLERMGGVMVYDVTDPRAPTFVDYLNTRENWVDSPATVLATVGDLGVEGITFVSAEDSPNGAPLLITGNEVSGTTAIYQIIQKFD